MTHPAQTGMMLGKFLPPHYGHVYLGDFARHFVKELTIVVGTLKRESIPGHLRYQWMKQLFPGVNVVHLDEELPQNPSEHPDFWQRWQTALENILPCRPEVVFASEPYGQKLAEVLGGRFIPVNPDRSIRPVSGTAVRADPYQHWDLIPPPVRGFYAKRVCIFGPESTGKSTLTQNLASHFKTCAVPEFARTLLEWREGKLDEQDLPDIARGQAASEDALAPYSNRLLFTDTDPLATCIWSDFLFGRTDPTITELAQSRRADLYLLTDTDVPWVPDVVRYLPEGRANFLDRCEQALIHEGRRYVKISGNREERMQQAVGAVTSLLCER
ncbi:AAA family ATPase [Propionivibrio sp.]|uniref:AAA family ATPase n=1 Tax=Propionivibrio sp. TaxID=2212460 RepID=UPI003BEFF107